MNPYTLEQVHKVVDRIYRAEARAILATLIRLFGGFDPAEEAMQEAFTAALLQWPREGVPQNPRAWLIKVARFKAIDAARRRMRMDASLPQIAEQLDLDALALSDFDESIEDDNLRLVFTCCHPALAPEARVALTLREVCGLTTEEIARAFLTAPATLAQRIVRAKAKIRDAGIPYELPTSDDLPQRLADVLHVVYLVFNEGYSASSGELVARGDLSAEAIRLGRLLAQMLPEPEVLGLLALMLLQESRRVARSGPGGDLILLENQDRSLWDRDMIAEGLNLIELATEGGTAGSFTLQAAIAAAHAQAPNHSATDWQGIAALYDELMRVTPSPIVELNRAVAVAMRDGPLAGATLIDDLLERGDLAEYHLAHSARADLYRRAGRLTEAAQSYRRALSLARQEPERRFLEGRLHEVLHASEPPVIGSPS